MGPPSPIIQQRAPQTASERPNPQTTSHSATSDLILSSIQGQQQLSQPQRPLMAVASSARGLRKSLTKTCWMRLHAMQCATSLGPARICVIGQMARAQDPSADYPQRRLTQPDVSSLNLPPADSPLILDNMACYWRLDKLSRESHPRASQHRPGRFISLLSTFTSSLPVSWTLSFCFTDS